MQIDFFGPLLHFRKRKKYVGLPAVQKRRIYYS